MARSLNNLAVLNRAQGKYGEAEPLYQQALKIYEKALGPEHPDVAQVLENYASLLTKMGQSRRPPLLGPGPRPSGRSPRYRNRSNKTKGNHSFPFFLIIPHLLLGTPSGPQCIWGQRVLFCPLSNAHQAGATR